MGTVLGGGADLLAGLGLLAIPGLGPVVAAGRIVATVTGAGLSGHDAATYAEGLRRGGTLVTVRSETLAERALAVLDRAGAIDIDERAGGWRAQGWTGGTLGAG